MTTALEGCEWSAARPGRTLAPGKTRYPFYRRLGGPQGWSERAENLVPAGIGSRTVQPLVSRYTGWGTQPTQLLKYSIKIHQCVVNMVVVWLHIWAPYWCMYVALLGSIKMCDTNVKINKFIFRAVMRHRTWSGTEWGVMPLIRLQLWLTWESICSERGGSLCMT